MTKPELSFMSIATEIAQQFDDGKNVPVKRITWLKHYSPNSRIAYEHLMDRVAEICNVESRDDVAERTILNLDSRALQR